MFALFLSCCSGHKDSQVRTQGTCRETVRFVRGHGRDFDAGTAIFDELDTRCSWDDPGVAPRRLVAEVRRVVLLPSAGMLQVASVKLPSEYGWWWDSVSGRGNNTWWTWSSEVRDSGDLFAQVL